MIYFPRFLVIDPERQGHIIGGSDEMVGRRSAAVAGELPAGGRTGIKSIRYRKHLRGSHVQVGSAPCGIEFHF